MSHKIQFWDSKISGKKKLALDNNELRLVKDNDHFNYTFQLAGYSFNVIQRSEDKFELRINDKNFLEIMKDERTGKLNKEKTECLKKKDKENIKKNNNEDDYYKRAMKYNGENYVEGEDDIYNIEEQRKRLEEFEKKKQEKMKNTYNNDYDNQEDVQRDYKTHEKKAFVLDEKTVRINRMIISNLKDIFGNDNIEQGGNLLDLNLNVINNNNNNNNNNYAQNNEPNNNFMQNSIFNDDIFDNNNNNNTNNNYNKSKLENNPDYYLNIMNNNLHNAQNPHNQAILDQFFDLTNNNNNMNNNNNNINMQFQNNNNYLNQNNHNNMMQNKNMPDDDFNPFD